MRTPASARQRQQAHAQYPHPFTIHALRAVKLPRVLALIDLGIKAAPFFAELRRHLPDGMDCVYYSRRGVVRSVLKQSGAKLSPRSRTLPAVDGADAAAVREIVGKKALATESAATLAQAPQLLADLRKFLDREQVGALLVWNGSGLAVSLAVHLARQRGLPVVFGENGYLPGTLQLDPEGVNQYASITAAVREGRASLPPDAARDVALLRALEDFRAGRAPASQALPRGLRAGWMSRLQREAERLLRAETWRLPTRLAPDDFPPRLQRLPDRFVLLPFQVTQDSQLILHSPLVGGDMHRLLQVVHAALRHVEPGARLVVKLHPAEHSAVLRSYRDLPRRYPEVLFTTRHPLSDLLPRCAAVVTINSTVGFEGIVFERPVVTLGQNFYTAPGLVTPVERIEDLPAALRDALALPPDAARRSAFLRYVYFRFLTHGSYRDFSDASFRAVAERITQLIGKSA